jgi:hypothetical protein
MAERRPGRPKSDANAAEAVDMLNREVTPGYNPSPSPKKRKTGIANENSPATKRRAIARPTEDVRAQRKSTRLARPTDLHRSGRAKHKQDRNGFDGPTTPPPSLKITKSVNRQDKAKPVLDGNNSSFAVEEDEEDATNPLMRSPAKSTRSYDKEIRQAGKVRDGESILVDAQPVKAPLRKQPLLKPRARVTNSALSKPISESAKSRPSLPRPQNRAAAAEEEEEEEEPGAGVSGHESSIEGDQTLRIGMPQEQQDRTAAAEEPMNSMEDQPMDGQAEEVGQLSSTKEVFARASGLYECKKSWDSMLEAVRDNLDEGDQDNRAAEIRELAGLIDAARLAYRAIRRADGANMEDKEEEIEELLVDIGERVRTMRATADRKRNSRLIRDVYVHGIPKMVQLLKNALVTRSLKEEPSTASLKELVKIIDATLDLCVKAYHWRPRPILEYGVKRRTRNVIKMSLEALRTAYIAAQHDSPDNDNDDDDDDEEEEARKFEKRQALAEHVAKYLAHELEKKQRAEHNRRERNRDRNRRRTNGALLQATTFDIDQLDLDDVMPAPALNGLRRSLPWTETGVMAARGSLVSSIPVRPLARHVPQVSRERTEDIPGPMARRWSEEEDSALLRGLEEFTDANRYLEIDEVYGSADGPLRGRDVDELMQRARFYKQSMASHIEEEREKVGNVDRWAYLLSVEG